MDSPNHTSTQVQLDSLLAAASAAKTLKQGLEAQAAAQVCVYGQARVGVCVCGAPFTPIRSTSWPRLCRPPVALSVYIFLRRLAGWASCRAQPRAQLGTFTPSQSVSFFFHLYSFQAAGCLRRVAPITPTGGSCKDVGSLSVARPNPLPSVMPTGGPSGGADGGERWAGGGGGGQRRESRGAGERGLRTKGGGGCGVVEAVS
jgi:hypothetical protein